MLAVGRCRRLWSRIRPRSPPAQDGGSRQCRQHRTEVGGGGPSADMQRANEENSAEIDFIRRAMSRLPAWRGGADSFGRRFPIGGVSLPRHPFRATAISGRLKRRKNGKIGSGRSAHRRRSSFVGSALPGIPWRKLEFNVRRLLPAAEAWTPTRRRKKRQKDARRGIAAAAPAAKDWISLFRHYSFRYAPSRGRIRLCGL